MEYQSLIAKLQAVIERGVLEKEEREAIREAIRIATRMESLKQALRGMVQ